MKLQNHGARGCVPEGGSEAVECSREERESEGRQYGSVQEIDRVLCLFQIVISTTSQREHISQQTPQRCP